MRKRTSSGHDLSTGKGHDSENGRKELRVIPEKGTMWGPQDSVQLVYNSNNYGLWYL